MKRRLAAVAAALAAALMTLATPNTPAARAATVGTTAGRVPADATATVPALSPAPQSLTESGQPLPIPAVAGVVTGAATDPSAVATTEAALRAAGVHRIVVAGDRQPAPDTPLTVWIGGPGTNSASARVLTSLHAAGPGGLPPEGYVLASGRAGGRAEAVLAGTDSTGTFYAAQTFRQLISPGGRPARMPSVTVRDWPDMQHRGVVESFYGTQWSQADRLDQIRFYGAHKMDTYVYAPKEDPYSRDRWRDPYPPDQLRQLGALVNEAKADHVQFDYTVSPGQDVCYSSDSDFAALVRKDQALYDVGVRNFALFFDDVPATLHCPQDQAMFGSDPSPAAAAQAYLLNRFGRDFLDTHTGTGPLLTVPTEYSGTGDDAYRDQFAALVQGGRQGAVVAWTGPSTVSATVSASNADEATAVFAHPLALWDNYPVNDYAPQRLFLGPVEGRAADLYQHGVSWFLANPMIQAAPSELPLQTDADYAWNSQAYDPQQSWNTALSQIGGPAAGALRLFADNSRSSTLDEAESPTLSSLIDQFWSSWPGGALAASGQQLASYFDSMAAASATLRSGLPTLAAEAAPWIDKLNAYGAAGAAATRALLAQQSGDDTSAWQDRIAMETAAAKADSIYESVAPGVVQPFLDRVRANAGQVVITSPADGTQLPAGTAVTVDVAVHSGSVPISRVDLYAGPQKVATSDAPPYRMTLPAVATSFRTLIAKAVDGSGHEISSTPVHVTVGSPEPALLVVGNDASSASGPGLAPGDAAVRDRLEYLGLPVVIEAASQSVTADASGKALIAISSTVASGDVNTKFREVAVPVIDWEAFDFDDLGMTTNQGENFQSAQIQVVNPSSPLAAGRSGVVTVYRGLDRIRWGVVAPSAQVAAVVPGASEDATLFGYDTGAQMVGLKAPARRVGIFLGDTGLDPQVVTPDAVAIFDASVEWLLGH